MLTEEQKKEVIRLLPNLQILEPEHHEILTLVATSQGVSTEVMKRRLVAWSLFPPRLSLWDRLAMWVEGLFMASCHRM